MKNILTSIPSKYRVAVYSGTVLFMVASMVLGIIDPEKYQTLVNLLQGALASVAGIIALANVTPDTSETYDQPVD